MLLERRLYAKNVRRTNGGMVREYQTFKSRIVLRMSGDGRNGEGDGDDSSSVFALSLVSASFDGLSTPAVSMVPDSEDDSSATCDSFPFVGIERHRRQNR